MIEKLRKLRLDASDALVGAQIWLQDRTTQRRAPNRAGLLERIQIQEDRLNRLITRISKSPYGDEILRDSDLEEEIPNE